MTQLDFFGPGPQGELFCDLKAEWPRLPLAADIRRRLEASLVEGLARGALSPAARPPIGRQDGLPGLADPAEAGQTAFGFSAAFAAEPRV